MLYSKIEKKISATIQRRIKENNQHKTECITAPRLLNNQLKLT